MAAALAAALVSAPDAFAVRLDPDGHGQALIYPYYTARNAPSGNAYVTALSVTNITASPKAVKVRFLEANAGAEVFDVNVFLDGYDVWTAGIVPAGAGAGLFTQDRSCTSPMVSADIASPTLFRNVAYAGDLAGDTLDRTYEGYIEVLEMAAIDPASTLAKSVSHVMNLSSPNASRAACTDLPSGDAAPAGLMKPGGGLVGSLSLINVNDGTAFSINATALARWSDKVQWGSPGSGRPNLADVSPKTSYVVDDGAARAFITRWADGRDAISALFMAEHLTNEFTAEPWIKAATDWVVTMPTKRFYVDRGHADKPFALRTAIASSGRYTCESLSDRSCGGTEISVYDRESQPTQTFICGTTTPKVMDICGAAGGFSMRGYADVTSRSGLFGSATMRAISLEWWIVNGWGDVNLNDPTLSPPPDRRLSAPPGMTTIADLKTGVSTSGATVAYYGLPVMGFSAQSYSTTGLPGINPNVLSNYGAEFGHRIGRRIEVAN